MLLTAVLRSMHFTLLRNKKKDCVLLQNTGFCCSILSYSAPFYIQELHHTCIFASIFGAWLAASSVNLTIPEDISSSPNTDFSCFKLSNWNWSFDWVKLPSSWQSCKSPETPLKQDFRKKHILGMLKSHIEPGSSFILRVASELSKQSPKEVQMANKFVGKYIQHT